MCQSQGDRDKLANILDDIYFIQMKSSLQKWTLKIHETLLLVQQASCPRLL